MAYNFQIKKNNIELLKKYENKTKTVSFHVESMLQNAKAKVLRVDYLRENSSWIRSKAFCEMLGISSPFWCRKLPVS
jgi:hypothetical protein